MEPETIPKTAAEVRIYDFNFSAQPEIENGDVITSVDELSATPSGLTIGTPMIGWDGKRVQAQLSGGTNGTRYLLKCRVVLTGGVKKLEMSGVLSVVDFVLPSV